jgi:hypothetical protein
MNSKESQTKTIQTEQSKNNSATMDLENLQKKYSNLLAKYKSAVNEYTNFLSDQAKNPDKKPSFTALNGYAVIGSERIGIKDITSLQECEASCAKLSNCTGATFITPNGNNRGCILSGGDPKVVRDFPGTFAIITKGKQLLLNMESINEELIATNKEIVDKIKNIEPVKDHINVVKSDSVEASKLYEDESLDFIFIDASHHYEFVKADIQAWYPKLKKGGYIGGHDYDPPSRTPNGIHGVFQAVNEIFPGDFDVVDEVSWVHLKK